MDLIDVLHQVTEDTMSAYGLSDMAVGTVTSVDPLEVTIRESMAPLPQEVLRLTASVIERKIPVVAHKHTTTGFRHSHTVSGLGHSHVIPAGSFRHSHMTQDGETSTVATSIDGVIPAALKGEYPTSEALTPDGYLSDEQLRGIVCYEDGKPLPVENGFIILNRGLAVGDKVLLLRVMRGQQFVILSRVFERGAGDGDAAAV